MVIVHHWVSIVADLHYSCFVLVELVTHISAIEIADTVTTHCLVRRTHYRSRTVLKGINTTLISTLILVIFALGSRRQTIPFRLYTVSTRTDNRTRFRTRDRSIELDKEFIIAFFMSLYALNTWTHFVAWRADL